MEYLPQPSPGEIDRIITNTSAPRSGGGSVLGGDVTFQIEAPNPEGPGGGPTDGGEPQDPRSQKDPDINAVNNALGCASSGASMGQYSNVNASGT